MSEWQASTEAGVDLSNWETIRYDAVMTSLAGGQSANDALATGTQVADALCADKKQDHWVVPNAVVNTTSTGYQAWSADGHLAVQNRDEALTWAIWKDGKTVWGVGARNQNRAVNWHFMWSSVGDQYYWLHDGCVWLADTSLGLNKKVWEPDLEPGQDIRSGTAGGQVQQHVTVYDSRLDHTSRIQWFLQSGPITHWVPTIGRNRFHQLLQCKAGYIYSLKDDTQHLSNLQAFDNSPPFAMEGTGGQIFSHPYVTPGGQSIVFARQDSGPNIGDVQTMPIDGKTDYTGAETLFRMPEMRAAYNAYGEPVPWVQWVYGHEVDGLMAYAVYEADPRDGTRIGGVSVWNRDTGSRNIVRGIRHKAEWTQWINPSLSPKLPDGTRWVAYQVGNDVHARKVSG